ncbi:MAG: hypothetical protein IJA79_07645 [Desulfovibrio sp.]|nr:hypothetical protein [Desulfovibrio sp.]
MKKALAKRIADILEKLGVVGVALALFQDRPAGLWLATSFLERNAIENGSCSGERACPASLGERTPAPSASGKTALFPRSVGSVWIETQSVSIEKCSNRFIVMPPVKPGGDTYDTYVMK